MRLVSALLVASLFSLPVAVFSAEPARWLKGNLHTHSLWSDGDNYPEMIADWYKRNGYQFLGISDHNVLQEGGKWFELKQPVSIKGEVVQRGGGAVLEKYLARFGSDWVEQRVTGPKREVRLKPLAEYRSLLEEPGRFLMIPAEEVTGAWKVARNETTPERGGPVHINAINLRDLLPGHTAASAVEVMRRTLDELQARLDRLNDQYEGQFGFRFVIFVKGRPRSLIADLMQLRLRATRDEELARALRDIVAIARQRLSEDVSPARRCGDRAGQAAPADDRTQPVSGRGVARPAYAVDTHPPAQHPGTGHAATDAAESGHRRHGRHAL